MRAHLHANLAGLFHLGREGGLALLFGQEGSHGGAVLVDGGELRGFFGRTAVRPYNAGLNYIWHDYILLFGI